MIGGVDANLTAPGNIPVTDLIIARMREFWPDGWFQDADSAELHRITEPWVSTIGSRSQEFFVFENRHSAEDWAEHGAMEENSNTMLHFLVGELKTDKRLLREVTMVCDAVDSELERLIKDLESTFFPSLLRLAA